VKIDRSYWLAQNYSISQECGKALAYSSGLPNIFLSLVTTCRYKIRPCGIKTQDFADFSGEGLR